MLEQVDKEVQKLLQTVNNTTLRKINDPYQVTSKSSYKDLVTTVDKSNERYIDQQLRQIDPESRILSEEGFGDHNIKDLQGHVWIVDPLDGTLNFVKQHNHFGIMLALYVDGHPTLGYIMDSVNQDLYHGGNNWGVFKNDQRLSKLVDHDLHDSLVAISSSLVLNNIANLPAVADHASGLRMYGSAAMEMIGVLTGELGAYISYLHPWDLAAGRVLATELGLQVKPIDGNGLNVLSSNLVLVATSQASQDILRLVN